MSSETRSTLLDRLRDRPDRESWATFFDLYAPLIFRYARRMAVPADAAEDLVQEVMRVVISRIRDFHYNQNRGRFRSWLRKITYYKVAHWREQEARAVAARRERARTLNEEADTCDLWEQQWRTQLLLRCVEEASRRVEALTYQAFFYYAIRGWPAQKVANFLDIDVDKVYVAKSRMLHLLRRIYEDLEFENS